MSVQTSVQVFAQFSMASEYFVLRRKPDNQWLVVIQFLRQTSVHPAFSVARGDPIFLRLACNQHFLCLQKIHKYKITNTQIQTDIQMQIQLPIWARNVTFPDLARNQHFVCLPKRQKHTKLWMHIAHQKLYSLKKNI